MSYWRLATTDTGWDTVTWLRERARNARHFEPEESFARALTKDLTREIKNMRFSEPRHSGLGIHLTVYERVKDYWVPELFKVSNWTDNTYTAVFPDGFKLGARLQVELNDKLAYFADYWMFIYFLCANFESGSCHSRRMEKG